MRLALAAVFGLLLAMRSLAPAGFMPAFDHGSVTIVACPDADSAHANAAHHHGDRRTIHQPCPYAAVSSLGALGTEWGPLLALFFFFAVALPIGRSFLLAGRQHGGDCPPATGPPLPA